MVFVNGLFIFIYILKNNVEKPNYNQTRFDFGLNFGHEQNAKSVSNMFGGTRDKCSGCTKTVYPIEKVILYNKKKYSLSNKN